MKRGMVTVMMLVALIFPIMAGAAKNPWEKKLPFKSATIHYELTGMETGQETLYIRKHGQETARYQISKTSMLGMTMDSRTVMITTPDWLYIFDLEERTGTKSINPEKAMIEEYNKLSKAEKKEVAKNAEEMGTSMMNGMNGSVEKKAKKILGYSCDLTQAMGSTIYTIHDTPIALYSDSNIMGMKVKSVATKFDKGSVDGKYFKFPEGIEPQPDPDGDQMARVIAKQTIAALKDPEAFKKSQQQSGKPATSASPRTPGNDSRQEEIPPEDQQVMEETMKALKGLFGN